MTNTSWIFEAVGYNTCLSELLYILLSSLKLLFKTEYYRPNFVERQRFCNRLVPLLNLTTSLAFNLAEVQVVNGLQPDKISSRVEQKHLPETVPSPDSQF